MSRSVKVVIPQTKVRDWHTKLTRVQVDLKYLRGVVEQMDARAIESYLDGALADLDNLQGKLPPLQKKLPF